MRVIDIHLFSIYSVQCMTDIHNKEIVHNNFSSCRSTIQSDKLIEYFSDSDGTDCE